MRAMTYFHDKADGVDGIDELHGQLFEDYGGDFYFYWYDEDSDLEDFFDDVYGSNPGLGYPNFYPGIQAGYAWLSMLDQAEGVMDDWFKNMDNNPFECWIDPGTNLQYSDTDKSLFFREAGIHLTQDSPLIEYVNMVNHHSDI